LFDVQINADLKLKKFCKSQLKPYHFIVSVYLKHFVHTYWIFLCKWSYLMFFKILWSNKTGSCETKPICWRNQDTFNLRISTPSKIWKGIVGYYWYNVSCY